MRYPIQCKCHVRLTLAISICSLQSWQIFSMSLIFHCSPQANDSQSINVFFCLPLVLLPSIIPGSAIASNWLFLMMCPTNRICLLTIIFRRFLDVLALWSTSSFDTLSVHAICNIRLKNHISVASNCDSILWLTVQLRVIQQWYMGVWTPIRYGCSKTSTGKCNCNQIWTNWLTKYLLT